MITSAQFLVAFPEFTSAQQATVGFWIAQAYTQLNAYRLGTQIDYAAMLFAAHNLSLSNTAQTNAQNGSPLGVATGPMNAKAVGDVSIGYDPSMTTIEGAGSWNATDYGQRLYQLLRGASLGGTYVGRPRRPDFPVPGRASRGLLGF